MVRTFSLFCSALIGRDGIYVLGCTSEWVHRKRRFELYAGFLFLAALNYLSERDKKQ